MSKRVLIIALFAVLGFGGSLLAYTGSQSENSANERVAMGKKNEAVAIKNKENSLAIEKGGDSMHKDNEVMTLNKGNYTSYDSAKLANADKGKVVLFFHASWCPTCREANKNFESSQAPNGLTLLKVDYDSSNELKKKYGVTYQHTFVQVDKDGNMIKKWNGSSSYDAITAQEI